MRCPKCGRQNPDNAQICNSCRSELTGTSETVKVTTSRLAIASLILGILTSFTFSLALMLKSDILAFICLGFVISALVLGIISLALIGLSAGRVAGKGLAVMGISIPILLFLAMYLYAVFSGPRMVAFRMVCGSNLSGIGRAMLIYANDYDNELPRIGRKDTIWKPKINNWKADNKFDAFGLKPDGSGGSATISSSLYLLVKYAEVTSKSFICQKSKNSGDLRAKEFKPRKYGVRDKEPEDLWDFGPEPAKHYSYSYHMPYGPYPLSTATSDPDMAVAADRNPWLDPYTDTTGFKWIDFTKSKPPEDRKSYRKGNSGLHEREGQNVLFMDNHVYFEKVSYCGVNQDNIYTYWNGPIIQQGAPPVIGSRPKDKLDSLLVNDPPIERK